MYLAVIIGEMMKSPNPCTLTRMTLLSPLGKIEVSGCGAGVHNLSIQAEETLAERSHTCVVAEVPENMPSELQVCADWLQTYFSDPQSLQRLRLPALHHPILLKDSFTSRVLRTLLTDVNLGETVSYKRLAKMAGNSRAVRAVGGAMCRNPVPLLIPCHRVISSTGQPGNYMGGKGNHVKRWLLAHEEASS